MSDNTTIKLCILWEGELREAARLMRQAHGEGMDDETRARVMTQAFEAAAVALWGLTDDHACVLVGSDEIRKKRKAARSAETQEAKP